MKFGVPYNALGSPQYGSLLATLTGTGVASAGFAVDFTVPRGVRALQILTTSSLPNPCEAYVETIGMAGGDVYLMNPTAIGYHSQSGIQYLTAMGVCRVAPEVAPTVRLALAWPTGTVAPVLPLAYVIGLTDPGALGLISDRPNIPNLIPGGSDVSSLTGMGPGTYALVTPARATEGIRVWDCQLSLRDSTTPADCLAQIIGGARVLASVRSDSAGGAIASRGLGGGIYLGQNIPVQLVVTGAGAQADATVLFDRTGQ